MRNGLKICRPTGSPAIVVTGSGSQTASIVGQGSVEFANATSLSLNGVFTTTYDNYMIVCKITATNNQSGTAQLTTGGTPASSGYTIQWVSAQNTTIGANRVTSSSAFYIGDMATVTSGWTAYLFGPHLSQPTAIRSIEIFGQNNAEIFDFASSHSTSASYDGLKMQTSVGNMTGLISVYGMVN